MNCKNCDQPYNIVNKKYGLCDNCNHIRLHGGQSKSERQKESATKYRQKYIARFRQRVQEETDEIVMRFPNKSKIRKSTIKQQTPKEAKIKSALSALKTSIELEAVQNNEYFCKGCGTSHPGLDKSHILSVGQYKGLELIKENMQLMCRTCHKIWESGTIEEQIALHCFIDNMIWIYFYSTEAYNKFLTRIEDYLVWVIKEEEKLSICYMLDQILAGIEQAGG